MRQGVENNVSGGGAQRSGRRRLETCAHLVHGSYEPTHATGDRGLALCRGVQRLCVGGSGDQRHHLRHFAHKLLQLFLRRSNLCERTLWCRSNRRLRRRNFTVGRRICGDGLAGGALGSVRLALELRHFSSLPQLRRARVERRWHREPHGTQAGAIGQEAMPFDAAMGGLQSSCFSAAVCAVQQRSMTRRRARGGSGGLWPRAERAVPT